MPTKQSELSEEALSRIIEMAWEDRTPFEAIVANYGLAESEVIKLMRASLKPSSFSLWRKRVSGRKTKHVRLRGTEVTRGYCKTQYKQRSK
ncbi:MAG: TIGR03643 family protein [Pseudomonadota bacterium]